MVTVWRTGASGSASSTIVNGPVARPASAELDGAAADGAADGAADAQIWASLGDPLDPAV